MSNGGFQEKSEQTAFFARGRGHSRGRGRGRGRGGSRGRGRGEQRNSQNNEAQRSQNNNARKEIESWNCLEKRHISRFCEAPRREGRANHNQRGSDVNASDANQEKTNTHIRDGACIGVDLRSLSAMTPDELNNSWYLYSSASNHMSGMFNCFKNYRDFKQPVSVKLGDGRIVKAVGIGDIEILSWNGKKWDQRFLADVYYMPAMEYNPFFVRCGHRSRNYRNDKKKRDLFYREDEPVAIVKKAEFGNLYCLNFKPRSGESALAAKTIDEPKYVTKGDQYLRLWHERMAPKILFKYAAF